MKNKEWTPEPVIKIPWMGCLAIFALMLFIGFCSRCRGSEWAKDFSDVYRATCRVKAEQAGNRLSYGSGLVVGHFDGFYWVLTNHHVVDNAKTVELHFFGDGLKMVRVTGQVVANYYDEKSLWDFARIKIPEKELAAYDPPFVPLAKSGAKPDTSKYLITCGCGSGRWASLFKGGVENYYGDTAQFYPAPIPGQSGSSIIQLYNGKPYVNAILTYRIGNDTDEDKNRGGAIPIAHYYNAVRNRRKTGDGLSIPPDAVPVACCLRNGCQRPPTGYQPPITSYQNVIWDQTIWSDPAVVTSRRQVSISSDYLLVIEKAGCVNCDQINPELQRLREQGYNIEVRNVTMEPKWQDLLERENVREYPAFFLVRRSGTSQRISDRWGGIRNARNRIITAFTQRETETAGTPCEPAQITETVSNPCDPVALGPLPKEDVAEPAAAPCEPASAPCEPVLPPKPTSTPPSALPQPYEIKEDDCSGVSCPISAWPESIGKDFQIVPEIKEANKEYRVNDDGKKDYIFMPSVYEAAEDDPLTQHYESGFFQKETPNLDNEEDTTDETRKKGCLGSADQLIAEKVEKLARGLILSLFGYGVVCIVSIYFFATGIICGVKKLINIVTTSITENRQLKLLLNEKKNQTKGK